MAAPKRTPFERERDLELTTKLYIRGKTQQEIADRVGVSREQIAYDIADIKKRWRESEIQDFNEAVVEQLRRLDELEQAHWAAWERSFESSKSGEPAYLSGAIRCGEQRAKILGLYAPERKEVSGPNGAPIHLLNQDERLERINQLLEQARVRSGSAAAIPDPA